MIPSYFLPFFPGKRPLGLLSTRDGIKCCCQKEAELQALSPRVPTQVKGQGDNWMVILRRIQEFTEKAGAPGFF